MRACWCVECVWISEEHTGVVSVSGFFGLEIVYIGKGKKLSNNSGCCVGVLEGRACARAAGCAWAHLSGASPHSSGVVREVTCEPRPRRAIVATTTTLPHRSSLLVWLLVSPSRSARFTFSFVDGGAVVDHAQHGVCDCSCACRGSGDAGDVSPCLLAVKF